MRTTPMVAQMRNADLVPLEGRNKRLFSRRLEERSELSAQSCVDGFVLAFHDSSGMLLPRGFSDFETSECHALAIARTVTGTEVEII